MSLCPIAVFTFNRPDHTRRTLLSLSNCNRLDECPVTVYCDGARFPEERDVVESVRKIVKEWANEFSADIVLREENLGLADSIILGVTELCRRHSRVIVVEDDLSLNSDFIDYMLRALERFENESEVYQISGYMFPIEHPENPNTFLLPLITTWGWATWQRAWEQVDWTASGAREMLSDARLRRAFDLDNSYPYSQMLLDRLQNKNNSWGILFWWTVFKAKGLALHPRESYVLNHGFDQSGTHCGDHAWSKDAKDEVDHSVHNLRFPNELVTDDAAFNRIKTFLKSEQYPSSLPGRIWRRVERFAAGRNRRTRTA